MSCRSKRAGKAFALRTGLIVVGPGWDYEAERRRFYNELFRMTRRNMWPSWVLCRHGRLRECIKCDYQGGDAEESYDS